MKTRQFTLFFLSVALGLAVVLSGCSPAPVPAAASSPARPEQVVEGFYRWYTGQPGSPLAGGAYRSSAYLSPDFVQKVDGIIASFDGGGYDPFLCAQDVPGDFTVGEAAVADQVASVVVRQVWNPGTEYELVRDLRVGLLMEDGQWKIADVDCGTPAATTPEQAVVAHTSFEGHTFTVELQQVGGRWAISDVLCAERAP